MKKSVESAISKMLSALVFLLLFPGTSAGEESEDVLEHVGLELAENLGSICSEAGFRLTYSNRLGVLCGFEFQVSEEDNANVVMTSDTSGFYFLIAKSKMGDQTGQFDAEKRMTCEIFEPLGLTLRYYSLANPDWKSATLATELHKKLVLELGNTQIPPDNQ